MAACKSQLLHTMTCFINAVLPRWVPVHATEVGEDLAATTPGAMASTRSGGRRPGEPRSGRWGCVSGEWPLWLFVFFFRPVCFRGRAGRTYTSLPFAGLLGVLIVVTCSTSLPCAGLDCFLMVLITSYTYTGVVVLKQLAVEEDLAAAPDYLL